MVLNRNKMRETEMKALLCITQKRPETVTEIDLR